MAYPSLHTTHFTGNQIPQNLKALVVFDDGTELYKCTNSIFVLTKNRASLDLGGKAQGLIHIEQQGRHIPLTILVSAEVFSDLESGDHDGSRKKEVVEIIRESAKLTGIEDLIMLRSSGAEDMPSHTAAGLFHSEPQFLAAENDNLFLSVKRVIESGNQKMQKHFILNIASEKLRSP